MIKHRDTVDYTLKLRAILALTFIAITIFVGIFIYKAMKNAINVQNNQIEEIQKQIGE